MSLDAEVVRDRWTPYQMVELVACYRLQPIRRGEKAAPSAFVYFVPADEQIGLDRVIEGVTNLAFNLPAANERPI